MILSNFPLPAGTYAWTSPFGMRTHPVTGARTLHKGQDLGSPQGTPIFAAISGRMTTGYEAGGAGNWVNITAGNIIVKCFHLSRYAQAPVNVTAGTIVGYVGTTGSSTGAHLHFEIWQNGQPIDPAPELRAAPIVGQEPPAPAPEEEEEDVTVIVWSDYAAYTCNGLFKRRVTSMDDVARLKYMGVKDMGKNNEFLNLLTEIPTGKVAGDVY